MRTLFMLLAALMAASLMTVSGAVAQDGYRIQSGDVLRIEVLEDPTLGRAALVTPDGRISLPLAGNVMARGRSVEQVQSELADRLAKNFAVRPNVFVSLQSLAERRAPGAIATQDLISIYVLGEAARPGRLDVEKGTTLLQLFSQMGGFSDFAAKKRIQLRRTDPQSGKETIYSFNYKMIERGQSNSGSTVMADGDVVVIPQRGLFE